MDARVEPPVKAVKELPIVLILGLSGFCSALAIRIVDPLIPEISRDLSVHVTTAALLSSAFAMPYAFGQPILGPLGDALGKARIVKICMIILTVALAIAAFAPSFVLLFAARVAAGFAGGGIIPLSMAMLGDRFDMEKRQIAISRFMVMTLMGQIVGAALAGMLEETLGWRGVLLGSSAIAVVALVGTLAGLKPRPGAPRGRFSLAEALERYASVLRNPRAKICYAAVFVEGITVYGLFPHIAALLEQQGKGGAHEAGLVIAGMGVGGILYAAVVPWLLAWLGVYGVMSLGGLVAAAGLALAGYDLGLPIGVIAFVIMGAGFYMLHNSLQTQATELSPTARGSALALHAFSFFVGQAIGPVVFGQTIIDVGARLSIWVAAAIVAVLGIATAQGLRRAGRP